MSPERWQQIQQVFDKAIELAPAAQAAFLKQLAADDKGLHDEVADLIAADQAAGTFLGKEAAQRMAPLIVESDPDEPEEERVGVYRIVSRIGRGGMGSVYLAERADGQFQQQVALKIIRRGLDTEDILSRFLYERQILASLDHPNIARLYDGGMTTDGRPYFVMEYVDGVPLDQYCNTHRLTPQHRLELFRTVGRTVQYAHQNMVIHRDLKPSNILVTQTGEVKLLDFGIAKLVDEEAMPLTRPQTTDGLRLMTPEYASPEQVRGLPVTTATDVYALGVLLYELLTGRRPYEISERVQREIERVILEEEPTRPSTAISRVTPDTEPAATTTPPPAPASITETHAVSLNKLKKILSGDLDNIILKALKKEPERRYGTVDQLLGDVRNYLDGLPVSAHRDSLGYRTLKFVQRHKVGVAAASVIALLGMAVFVFSLVTASQARQLAEERDRVALEAEKAERVQAFLISIFDVADPGKTDGQQVTARDILEQGVVRIEEELAEQPALKAELLDAMGEVYIMLSDYAQARTLYTQSLDLKREVWEGQDHVELAYTMHQIAQVDYFEGKYEASEAGHHAVLDIRRRLYESDHPNIAYSLSQIAMSQWGQGQYADAAATLQAALEMRQRLPEIAAHNVAPDLKNLGALHTTLAQYGEAEQYLRQALEGFRSNPDVEVYWIPNTLSDLAMVLMYQGNYEEAESLMRESLQETQRIYGDLHDNVAAVMGNLGLILARQQKYAEAERIEREALAIRQQLYPGVNAQVAYSLSNLGSLLNLQGRPGEAEPMLQEALRMRRQLYGTRHPNVQATLSSLCGVLKDQQRFVEANTCFRESYEMGRSFFEETHINMLAERMAWAEMYTVWGRYADADSIFTQVVPQAVDVLGDNHRVTGRMKASWGSCLLHQERYAEAEPLLVEGYAVHMETRGPENPLTQAARADLVTLYEALGQPDVAATYQAANGGGE